MGYLLHDSYSYYPDLKFCTLPSLSLSRVGVEASGRKPDQTKTSLLLSRCFLIPNLSLAQNLNLFTLFTPFPSSFHGTTHHTCSHSWRNLQTWRIVLLSGRVTYCLMESRGCARFCSTTSKAVVSTDHLSFLIFLPGLGVGANKELSSHCEMKTLSDEKEEVTVLHIKP
jgi:hypothetical protein